MSEGRVAIVTGGAQGLGAAIATALLQKGYRVCVADIQTEKGQAFASEQNEKLGKNNVTFHYCDVSNEEDYEKTFVFTLHTFGKVDLLVNNAGILNEKDPCKTLNVNLLGSVFACKQALKFMGKRNGGQGGTVIFVASRAGLMYHHSVPVYVASKHGVVGLTRSYGTRFHEDREGVVFCAACPELVETELLSRFPTHTLEEGLDFSGHPGIMSPEYVAQGVMKLLEDRINGSTMVISKTNGFFYVGVPKEVLSGRYSKD